VYLIKQKGNFYLNSSFGFHDPKFEINDLGYLGRTDVINMHLGGGYQWTEPDGMFRRKELGGGYGQSFDFDGNLIHNVLVHWGFVQFMNFYSINYNIALNPSETVNARRTRGGPLTLNEKGFEFNLNGRSDDRNSVYVEAGVNTYTSSQSKGINTFSYIQYRPSTSVTVSVGPEFGIEHQNLQYLLSFSDPLAVSTYGRRYVFGELDQKTYAANIRVNWTFTPELSLQLFAQPFIATGSYSKFKELQKPKSDEYLIYGNGNSTLVKDASNTYQVDSDGSGTGIGTSFGNPDFNVKSIRGNAVLRWEYLPGSTVYFVWTQTRENYDDAGEFQFSKSLSRLASTQPDNIFMIKMSYYLNM
jgi:hypothetical protein